ncbi:MAG: hypothetical protein AAFY20_09615 [Cyanobacteria bacterium J06639_14]
MQFIHCETYQGAIAAVHVEFPTQELYGSYENMPSERIISPVVIDQVGDVCFLLPVSTVDEAIASAKAHIENRNHSYINHIIEDNVPSNNAIQHFEECGIPLAMVPFLKTEDSYLFKEHL